MAGIKRERIKAIEYMRGISMLGVVAIHVGSQYIVNNPTANMNLVAVYEIITRFSVPIFFFISAFGLFYNLDINKKFDYRAFLKRRFKTVLVPYITWSIIYILLYGIAYGNILLLHPVQLAFVLFFGLACYQLYFMVILLWFYLFMPLWIFVVKHSNCKLLVILFILQMIFDYYSSFIMNPYGITNTAVRNLLIYRLNYWVAHYVFIFVLGGYLAVHFDEFKIFMRKNRMAIIMFFAVTLLGMLGYYYQCLFIKKYTLLEAINTAHQLSPAGIFYTLGATIFLFSEFYNGKCPTLLQKLFAVLGKHSYFAYLCHPVFISLLAFVMTRFNIVMTAVNSIVFYILTITFTVITAKICNDFSEKYCSCINEVTIGKYRRR